MHIVEYKINQAVKVPLKIAFVADLHDKSPNQLIKLLKTSKPDVILCAGDILEDASKYSNKGKKINENGLDFFRQSSTIAPVFYTIGNHEYHLCHEVRDEINAYGVTILENSWVNFGNYKIGGWLNGEKSKPLRKQKKINGPDFKWLNEFSSLDGFKILLCHRPEYYKKYIEPTNINLTLSGHAHGGQWRFFGHGLYSPGQGIFPKYTSGVHENRFVISTGLANTLKFCPRLFNETQLVIINLTPNNE